MSTAASIDGPIHAAQCAELLARMKEHARLAEHEREYRTWLADSGFTVCDVCGAPADLAVTSSRGADAVRLIGVCDPCFDRKAYIEGGEA